MKDLLIHTLISTVGLSLKAQTNLDSYRSVWNDNTQPDTTRFSALQKIAVDGYLYNQPNSAFYLGKMGYNLTERGGLKKQMSIALNTQGAPFWLRGDYPKALDYHQRGKKIQESTYNKQGVSGSTGNIGPVYHIPGDDPKVLNDYRRDLKNREKIDAKKGIANPLNKIGMIVISRRPSHCAIQSPKELIDPLRMNLQRKILNFLLKIADRLKPRAKRK